MSGEFAADKVVYDWYDGPIMFGCEYRGGHYMAMALDGDRFLCAKSSAADHLATATGLWSVRRLFDACPLYLWAWGDVDPVAVDAVPDEWLPGEAFHLCGEWPRTGKSE